MGNDIDISAQVGAYPACGACGSREIRRDAWAEWNMASREWELQNIFDDFCCDACGLIGLPDWKLDEEFRTQWIRRLNDLVRHGDLDHATVVVTQGVRARGETFVQNAAKAVIAFNAFTEDNDPHGEHDFGAVEVKDQKIFWKIDYFDLALNARSPDPANRDVTHRVLTIMLASEY
ncbi:DUF3768 domain-containing protein [Aestuariicoccus sp. MJ-SS9]|uniref:DUF3768 domain-containing protein n=1 Tax=Aestuariicoccus sp. MJ-SS9 TaxID=3079855 RepID=UPI00290F139D|nr:DUF3768 domain-containing protein [Aestuariicoccus sp. MJ-SS9]MDU8914197.1 DUF3768 domain-containing protein [Aestuariicoccus sp. MJ-SS9]